MAWSVSVGPGWDLWGAAMLGTAALCGLAWFAVVARRLSGRPTSLPLVSLGLAELGFLTAAALGTLQQLGSPLGSTPGDVDATATPSALPPQSQQAQTEAGPDPEARTGGDEAPEADVPAPAADTDGEDGPPGENDAAADTAPPTEPDPAEDDEPRPPAAGLQVGTALDPVPALPDDASERRAAIRRALRSARLVYEEDTTCKDAAAVGRAWATVAAIPKDERSARASVVAKRLEECRRQVRWATTYSIHRARLAAREAFEETLSKRLSKDHEIKTFIKISGRDHEKMRVGSGGLTDELAEAVMTDALQHELAELGFERVVLATGKKVWTTDLEARLIHRSARETQSVNSSLRCRPYGARASST